MQVTGVGSAGGLPRVVTTSVIRSASKGESHGGAYIVDLQAGKCEQVLDWNKDDIGWAGRGGDRGLRGIAFYGNHVLMASSNEILIYDSSFKLIESYTNQYMNWCHEIFVFGNSLYVTSTSHDSLLEFDLERGAFTKGYCIRRSNPLGLLGRVVRKILPSRRNAHPVLSVFDPNKSRGPSAADTIHLNSVTVHDGVIYASGTGINALLSISEDQLATHAYIPRHSHNAQPYGDGVLLNSTREERTLYTDCQGHVLGEFPVRKYPEELLLQSDTPKDHARPYFARGLCLDGKGLLVVGSSPATVTAWSLDSKEIVASVNLTMDIRNAIHGLDIWPF